MSLWSKVSPAPSPLQDSWTEREMDRQSERSTHEPRPVPLQLPLSGVYSVLWGAARSPGKNRGLGVGRPAVKLPPMLLHGDLGQVTDLPF